MRGKPGGDMKTQYNARITPAHAGKTSMMSRAQSGTKDHPRACGENYSLLSYRNAAIGSPPRMRGKHSRERLL